MCSSVLHACLVLTESLKGCHLLELQLQAIVSCCCDCRGPDAGLAHAQRVLLAFEPSLRPYLQSFNSYKYLFFRMFIQFLKISFQITVIILVYFPLMVIKYFERSNFRGRRE